MYVCIACKKWAGTSPRINSNGVKLCPVCTATLPEPGAGFVVHGTMTGRFQVKEPNLANTHAERQLRTTRK